MNILFFTKSKKYTCKSLEYMLNEHTVVGVVCKNKQILRDTDMEQICIQNEIDIYDNEELYRRIEENTIPHIDLAISNTYGRLIKPSFINFVNGNCINFHGAILPDYKGLYAYNHGLLNEEKQWGVTAHYVNERFDEGEIIEIKKFPIYSRKMSVKELEEETQKKAYELTIELIERWKTEGKLPSHPQPSGGRYYSNEDFELAKKVLVTDSADVMIKKIHAFWCPPYEGAYIEIDGVRFQLCMPEGAKAIAKQIFEERVINAACEFIKSLELDVYEQQFHYSFQNWLPFFWNRYTAITRYTYVLDNLENIEEVWQRISSKGRKLVKKGQRNSDIKKGLSPEVFYKEHEKVFLKQGLQCPFSEEQWMSFYSACKKHNACEIFYALENGGNIASLLFLMWDEESAYLLLGGSIPIYQNLDTYSAVIWESIKYTADMDLKYDFEGSVIKRISKLFREFGGESKPYFRIRKVFNPEIMRAETEKTIIDNFGLEGDKVVISALHRMLSPVKEVA